MRQCALWAPADFPDLAAIRDRWAAIERSTADFVSGLDQDRLGGILTYRTTRGTARAEPLWPLVLHQANHATQHRSEAAYLLTQFGCSPGDLDFVYYVEQHQR